MLSPTPEPPATPLRIVIVEDLAMLAGLLKKHCEGLGHQVLACPATGDEAVTVIREMKPDLVLLDLGLPDMDGADIAKIVRDEQPDLRILILSAICDPVAVERVRILDVHGFLDKKSGTVTVLREAIDSIAAGGKYYSPLFLTVLDELQKSPTAFTKMFTDAEKLILEYIGATWSDDEIAHKLSLSPQTIQSRRRNLLRKTGLHSTPQLIRYAIENGFARPERMPEPPNLITPKEEKTG